jgi:hypothetical protein
MPRYFVQSPHTPEECLKSLDELLARGDHELGLWDFGCATGDHSNHTAYATLQAGDEAGVLNLMPPSFHAAARVTEVGKFTPEQVRSYHT